MTLGLSIKKLGAVKDEAKTPSFFVPCSPNVQGDAPLYSCMLQNRKKAGLSVDQELYEKTLPIWQASDKTDITGGALEYAPVEVANSDWAKDKKVTAILGKYVFYRFK